MRDLLKLLRVEKIEDLFTDEEQAELTRDLQRMAFQRRAAEAASANVVMH